MHIDPHTLKSFGRNAASGEAIYQQGEPAEKLFGLVSGQVKLVRTVCGKSLTVALVGPGEFFGAVEFLTHRPFLCTARAEVAAQIVAVNRPFVESYLLAHPKVMHRLLVQLAHQQALLIRQIENLLSTDIAYSAINTLVGLVPSQDGAPLPHSYPELVEVIAHQVRTEKEKVEDALSFLVRSGMLEVVDDQIRALKRQEIEHYLVFLGQRLQFVGLEPS